MELHFFRVGCADAARISFKDDMQQNRHIFIDAGFERTYRNILESEIRNIDNKGESIDLWIISHIHDDHIGGVISYLNAIRSGQAQDIVKQWLYNSPRTPQQPNPYIIGSRATSIRQGDEVSGYLSNSGKWKRIPVTSGSEEIHIGGLKITLLSPNNHKLSQFLQKYESTEQPLEKSEIEITSEAKRAAQRDYHVKATDFDPEKWEEDKNLENGSSIAFLTTYKGFKILWLSDAHPSTIIEGLKCYGYHEDNPLNCHWVKVAHHGSAGNNSAGLYNMISCTNYLFSVNGDNIHGLPAKETMIRILKSPKRKIGDRYTFYFTHDDPILRSIFDIDGQEIFKTLNFEVIYLKEGKSLKVVIPL